MDTTVTNEGASQVGFSDELKSGTTLLHGQYVIEGFLNSGGFGMTYLAKDSLDRTVVIKECFPASFCCRSDTIVRARSRSQQKEFSSIVRLFVQEARRLSKLDHPNIVGVHQVFEDNGTAYMALDYVDGQDLLDIVDEGKRPLGPVEIRQMLLKTLSAVSFIHSENILHRDISPDNILLDQKDNPVLIDFGAAREKATKASRALSALLVVKDGYSPQEFYIAGGVHSPSSDLYALAATFYHLISGGAPPNSQQRLAAIAAAETDPYQVLVGQVSGYDHDFLAAIDKAMSVLPKDRIQSADDWMITIDQEKRTAVLLAQAKDDKHTELAISRLVSETNQAVHDAIKQDNSRKKHKEKLVRESVKKAAPRKVPERAPIAQPDALSLNVAQDLAVPAEEIPEDPYNYINPGEQSAPKNWLNRRPVSRRPSRRFWIFGKSRSEDIGKVGL